MFSISRSFSQILKNNAITKTTTPVQICALHTTRAIYQAQEDLPKEETTNQETVPELSREATIAEEKRIRNDRTRIIPVETSIRYLKSAAYQQTYGDRPVWEQYRRNHKGLIAPKKTRKTCIRKGIISAGNPCPICRDEYLVLDHRNIDLLKQFISKHTGEVLSYSKTGVCQKKHFELLIAVERAMDYGLIKFDVPFREYDYSEYYKNDTLKVKA